MYSGKRRDIARVPCNLKTSSWELIKERARAAEGVVSGGGSLSVAIEGQIELRQQFETMFSLALPEVISLCILKSFSRAPVCFTISVEAPHEVTRTTRSRRFHTPGSGRKKILAVVLGSRKCTDNGPVGARARARLLPSGGDLRSNKVFAPLRSGTAAAPIFFPAGMCF